MVLLIAYQFANPQKDTSAMETVIKSSGVWWHHINNVWIIETSRSPKDWYEKLSKFIQPGDNVIILDLKANGFVCLPDNGSKWLNSRKY